MKPLLDRLSAQPEVHLILDFDGTLIPIRNDRKKLQIPPFSRKVLTHVRRYPVTILSGRRADELKTAFHDFAFNLVSLNGFRETPELCAEGARIRECLAEILLRPGIIGTSVEDKGALTSLHFRHLKNSEIGPLLLEATQKMLKELGYWDNWHAYLGKMVVNIEPRIVSKATFVSDYLATFPAASVLFAGDDLNDFPVFELNHPRLFKVFIKSPILSRPSWSSTVTRLSRRSLLLLLTYLGKSE